MAERRIRIAKDKEALVLRLTTSDEGSSGNGTFLTRAQLMTFAAVYGYAKGSRSPFTDSLEPIRQEVFARQGHDTIINLLALATTHDPKCLAQNDDEAEELRISIFEAYANGGLERLRSELQGVDDPLPHLLLLLDKERKAENSEGGFDLTDLLG